jgi:hypothetical protein
MSVTFEALCVCVWPLPLSVQICLQRKDIADDWNYDTYCVHTSFTVSGLENFKCQLLCGVYKIVERLVFMAVVIHIVIF